MIQGAEQTVNERQAGVMERQYNFVDLTTIGTTLRQQAAEGDQ